MTFLEYCIQVFTNFQWYYAIEILLICVSLCSVFNFYANHNASWLAVLNIIFIILLAVMAILDFSAVKVLTFVVIELIVLVPFLLFSADLRRGLFRLSRKRLLHGTTAEFGEEELQRASANITKACLNISKSNTGALIVIADAPISNIVGSGTSINALLTSELLETIFYPKSPLHDGAVIIIANQIISAGCYLPLSSRTDLPREFGTRHRAAAGISEQYPQVTALVVSEETGIISAFHDGKYVRYLTSANMKVIVSHALRLIPDDIVEKSVWGANYEE